MEVLKIIENGFRACLPAVGAILLAGCQTVDPDPKPPEIPPANPGIASSDGQTLYAPELIGAPSTSVTPTTTTKIQPRAAAPEEPPADAPLPDETPREAAPRRVASPPPRIAPRTSDDTDVLRIGDFLIVKLGGVPAAEQRADELRINDEGTIALAHIPPVKAAGLTSGELEREIVRQYQELRIFSNPNVSVTPAGNRYINVIGEVRLPQRVPYTNDMTLLRAIAASGGFTDYANKRSVRIQRAGQIITVHAGEALKNPTLDPPLKVGDTIEVRRSIF